jgi:hypothetical protein
VTRYARRVIAARPMALVVLRASLLWKLFKMVLAVLALPTAWRLVRR